MSEILDIDELLKLFSNNVEPYYDDFGVKEGFFEYSNDFPKGQRWYDCNPRSLRGHIVNAHFQAITLMPRNKPLGEGGVARYDIELAHHRGFGIDWVVKKAFERLNRTDEEILHVFEHGEKYSTHSPNPDATPEEYRAMLVRNLKFIDTFPAYRNIIDWNEVARIFPQSTQVDLDVNFHCDASFKDLVSEDERNRHMGSGKSFTDAYNFKKILI